MGVAGACMHWYVRPQSNGPWSRRQGPLVRSVFLVTRAPESMQGGSWYVCVDDGEVHVKR